MVGFKLSLRLILCLLMLAAPFSTLADDAYITLQSETRDVFVGDAIIIDIEYAGLPEAPSFEQLRQITTFERETYGTRIAVIKGKVVEINIRRMEFTSHEAGTFLFGPLEVDDVLSNTISVKVLPAGSSSWAMADQDATVSMSLSNNNVSIYQMLTLDITLRHTFPIANENITLPQFNGFEIRSLVTARRTIGFESIREIKWKILLFPQTSGKHTIAAVNWSGTIVKSRTERAAFERASEPIAITVSPAINGKFSGSENAGAKDWWLPASNLKISENWSKDVRELTAGEAVTRTIRLDADGITSGQLPQPTILESRAISQTLVNVAREEKLTSDGISSSAIFTYRVTAQSPIPVFLDTVRVPWWNTTEGISSEAIIPARRVNIGLPERADLLASLAATDSRNGLFEHLLSLSDLTRVANTNRRALALTLICILLGTGIIWISQLLLAQSTRKRVKFAQKSLLIQLAQEEAWNSLYLAIDDQHTYITSAGITGNGVRTATQQGRLTSIEDSLSQLKLMIGKLAFRQVAHGQPDTTDISSTRQQILDNDKKKTRILKIIRSL